MFHVVLYQPGIPQNTGNIIRLCANTGATLHLIHPLAFGWDDRQLKRAGLDYHEFARVQHHDHWAAWQQAQSESRVWALTTRGEHSVFSAAFRPGDALLFGNESRGLPPEIHGQLAPAQKLRLPMQAASRSLNLANTVAVVLYEALRQNINSESLNL